MEGISGYLRRAREQQLLEGPTKVPVARENDENEVPLNAQDGSQPGQLKSCLKPASKSSEELPTSSAQRTPAPQELPVPAVLSDHGASTAQAKAVAESLVKSVVWATDLDSEPTDTKEAHAVASELSSEAPLRKDLSACEFFDDAFTGLPGMEVYRDVAGFESEDEAALSTAEYGDEEQSDDSEDDTLGNLTSLIATTKKLALGDESEPRTATPITNRIGRARDEVRAKFIGGLDNNDNEIENNVLSRQSFSEIEESDMGGPSEVLLSNFPLLPADASRNEGSKHEAVEAEGGRCFTPTQTTTEEQRANKHHSLSKPEDEATLLFGPDFSLFASDGEMDDDQAGVSPTPANTPFEKAKAPSSPLFRRSSAVYTPPRSDKSKQQQNAVSVDGEVGVSRTSPSDTFTFRRSSVVYTPTADGKRCREVPTTPPTIANSVPTTPTTVVHLPALRRSSAVYTPNDKLAPQTPPRVQEAPFKPPKTEAPQKTKSRIEVGSPLLGVCHSAPSVQLGVHPGSMTAPAKLRVQSRVQARRVVAVADTNVLLQHLTLVENTQNYPNVTLVIPSAVVRELDGLKNGSSLIARDARIALHSLRKLLKGAQSRSTIRFQNIDEVPESRSYRGRARSNDDRILDCCLYYAERAEEGQKVVLLTNDVALQVKAESFGQRKCALTAFSAESQPNLMKNGPPLISAMGMRAFYETEVWQSA